MKLEYLLKDIGSNNKLEKYNKKSSPEPSFSSLTI